MFGHSKAMAYAVRSISLSLAFVALNAALFAGGAAAQDGVKLQAQDYLDIRQLIDRYAHILDNCVNNGYRYADMFTTDGPSACLPSGVRVPRSGFADASSLPSRAEARIVADRRQTNRAITSPSTR